MGKLTIFKDCQHCGEKYGGINIARHEAKCMAGPAGERTFDFIRSFAKDARMPTRRDYDANRPKSMPSSNVLMEWAGGWSVLASRIGLSSAPPSKPYTRKLSPVEVREAAVGAWCDAAVARTYRILTKEASRAGSLMALHEWQEREWVSRSVKKDGEWQPIEVRREVYTVLR
jgi:hypothetical protein